MTERFRGILPRKQSYEALDTDDETYLEDEDLGDDEVTVQPFSRFEYAVFLFGGVAMLWAWNMFMAAAPYFQQRFSDSAWIQSNFQSANLSVSTVTNLGTMLVLAKVQQNASYPKRITVALFSNIGIFLALALSTISFRSVSPAAYLVFILLMVFGASFASALCQNGLFSYASGFGRGEYVQAIMTGQAVAGVLPCVAQIVSAACFSPSSSDGEPQDSSLAAFLCFLAAMLVSLLALLLFLHLHNHCTPSSHPSKRPRIMSMTSSTLSLHQPVSLFTLFSKLYPLCLSVSLCFAISMVFPVFTSKILSVHETSTSKFLRPEYFVPFAFLIWNSGDLLGRLLVLSPRLRTRPRMLFLCAVARLSFIPLYLLCNVNGRGAVVNSDLFYLGVVQFMFGITNGWVGSNCMVVAGNYVDMEEREAAGGYMGLWIVVGLTVGSLSSFWVVG